MARIPCCVPFCRRTRAGDPQTQEWICWDHWKTIPLTRRRAYLRAVAERAPSWLGERRHRPRYMIPRPHRDRSGARPRTLRAVYRLWGRLKRMAIERVLGVATEPARPTRRGRRIA